MALRYTTALAFNQFMQMAESVPDYPSDYAKEKATSVSTSVYYLGKRGLIEDTLQVYTGSTAEASATTLLSVTTHYTVDEDKSQITLTAAGIASVGANSVFTSYQYNKYAQNKEYSGMLNSNIVRALENAEDELNHGLQTVCYDSTLATPNPGVITNEILPGQGRYDKVYPMFRYPVSSLTAVASGAISASATTIDVVSTNGFPSSGFFAAETDKVTYTGKTETSFTGCSGVANNHATGITLTSWIVERALDDEGNTPNFQVMQWKTDYDINFEQGEVRLNNINYFNTIVLDRFSPPTGVWNRVRLSYLYGYNEIPPEIVRAVHLLAAKELFGAQVLNALSRGTNGFNSSGMEKMDQWITQTINHHRIWFVKGIRPAN